MSRAHWEWLFQDGQGALLDRPLSPVFTTRFDAEAWLGEHWRQLAEQGVRAVQLTAQGEPMAALLPLRPG
ncbi:MAG TPA: hypothetical protein VN257_01435 [Actinotalea sp.]|nr:hypothetical protein [Actinotalea sp.]